MGTPAEARQDMTRVLETLRSLKLMMAGRDQVEAAINRLAEVRHSPLRTAVDHAMTAAERVMEFIGNQVGEDDNPCYVPPGRDGGPI